MDPRFVALGLVRYHALTMSFVLHSAYLGGTLCAAAACFTGMLVACGITFSADLDGAVASDAQDAGDAPSNPDAGEAGSGGWCAPEDHLVLCDTFEDGAGEKLGAWGKEVIYPDAVGDVSIGTADTTHSRVLTTSLKGQAAGRAQTAYKYAGKVTALRVEFDLSGFADTTATDKRVGFFRIGPASDAPADVNASRATLWCEPSQCAFNVLAGASNSASIPLIKNGTKWTSNDFQVWHRMRIDLRVAVDGSLHLQVFELASDSHADSLGETTLQPNEAGARFVDVFAAGIATYFGVEAQEKSKPGSSYDRVRVYVE